VIFAELFPPLAGLFAFILNTSQTIVKFHGQTSWSHPSTSRVMRRELNLELDNSRDKPEENKFQILSVNGASHSKQKWKLG